ncbi:tyrosine-type recombinase/integrase [Calidithermus timidus]|jgi:site-specific recombinase XerC|uniref:tyrosine-type recombinase/integrase n=1 Tax=Calidithermus timidus TaxID=307124 RepID=UPI0012F6C93C
MLPSLKNGKLGRRLSANGLWWRITGHYRAIGLPSRYGGLHMLRHTAGTRFYRSSRDLHTTACLLGHASPSTSAICAKMDLQGLFRGMDRLGEGEGRPASGVLRTPHDPHPASGYGPSIRSYTRT